MDDMKPGDKYYDGKVESTGRTIEEIEKDIKKEEERIKTITRMEEMDFYREGRKIYGELYKPAGGGPFPGVIFAHGYGGSHKDVADYAQAFADSGIAAYIFYFIGRGTQIKSDGKMTEMSVLTEAADFNVVFDGIRELSCIDKPRLFVGGASQGGFVATYIVRQKKPGYQRSDRAVSCLTSFRTTPEKERRMGRIFRRPSALWEGRWEGSFHRFCERKTLWQMTNKKYSMPSVKNLHVSFQTFLRMRNLTKPTFLCVCFGFLL